MEPSRTRDLTESITSLAGQSKQRVKRMRPRRVRTTCLLTPLHPERSLSTALVQHLSQEMPDIEFFLSCSDPDVIWVCGYELGSEGLIEELRVKHPDSSIVVTGRGSLLAWEEKVLAAGGDYCCGWPLPMTDLTQILRLA